MTQTGWPSYQVIRARGNVAGMLLLVWVWAVQGCAAPAQSATSKPGKHLKLETIRHDYATTYVYREVDDSQPTPSPRP